MSRAYDDGENVLVRFYGMDGDTAKAYKILITVDDIEGVWIPRSQVADIDWDTHEMWIPLWLAEKKGLEYE